MFSALQKRKCAIKVATAHADSVTGIVERDDRCHDNVQQPGSDDFAANRLRKTESIDLDVGIRGHFAKPHNFIFCENWRKNALFHVPTALNNRPRINFIRRRQIASDKRCALKPARPRYFFCNYFRRDTAFVITKSFSGKPASCA